MCVRAINQRISDSHLHVFNNQNVHVNKEIYYPLIRLQVSFQKHPILFCIQVLIDLLKIRKWFKKKKKEILNYDSF